MQDNAKMAQILSERAMELDSLGIFPLEYEDERSFIERGEKILNQDLEERIIDLIGSQGKFEITGEIAQEHLKGPASEIKKELFTDLSWVQGFVFRETPKEKNINFYANRAIGLYYNFKAYGIRAPIFINEDAVSLAKYSARIMNRAMVHEMLHLVREEADWTDSELSYAGREKYIEDFDHK